VPDPFPKSDHPLVSTVIPTRGRPQLLACAIRSVLRQTWSNLEIIVVVDGPDPDTAGYLDTITDSRLRVVFLTEHCGGCDARNAGVRAARSEWIAFLDDDDEWLPEKIERQMRAAHAMPDWFPVVSCRLIAQSALTRRVLPLKPYGPQQPIADFLFCRRTLRDPGGVIQSSTLLTARELLLAVPFQPGLKMHQDTDWIIRAASFKGVGFTMLRQPLSIWRVGDDRASVGSNPDWKFSLSWIRGSRDLVSPRAFSWFVAVQCVWRARASHASVLARLSILRAFLFEGAPGIRSSLAFLIFAVVPARIRVSLRKGLHGARGPSDAASGLHVVFTSKSTTPVLHKSAF
jgi:glycosyltransferase involved in cell wall biosynthesis